MATDDKLQNSVSELVQPEISNKQDAKATTNETFTPSVFVNSEPMREEQVQNAMKFLSHPKVKGSPIMYRRSFLEKKGLTKEEIDEAFRRVPDPPSNASRVQEASTNPGSFNPASNVQHQTPTHAMQPAAPAGGITKAGLLTKYRFHWSHAFLAVGLMTASGAGTVVLIKNTILPRLKSWIRKIVLDEEDDIVNKTNVKPSLEEEAVAAAKTAAAAAVDAAKASQEMLNSKSAESRYFEEFTSILGVQVQEMKSMRSAIQKLEGQSSTSGRTPQSEQDYYRLSAPSVKQPKMNGNTDADMHSVRSSSSPAPAPATTMSMPAHPKSYMEIMAMVQRGEKPSNIREINDMPPNPNQQPSNPRLEPRSKPWEVEQVQYSEVQDNGLITPIYNDAPAVPWWQQKKAQITEIETEDQLNNSRPHAVANEVPSKRRWVPPQPPPVSMAEAAVAIRQPKILIRKEQTADDQFSSNPSDGMDELQRIQKISESGGVVEVETSEASSKINSGEIEEVY